MRTVALSVCAVLALAACGSTPSDRGPNDEAPDDEAAALAGSLPSRVAADPIDPPFAQIGGSNFIAFDTAGYRGSGNIFDTNAFRSPIAQYQVDPARVRNELHAMYANGQRTIALILWYAPEVAKGPATSASSGAYGSRGYLTSSAGGVLMPQHQANLKHLLADIVATGFREVQFRFASQASARSQERVSWDERWYQSNWNFVASTTKIVNGALAGSGVPVVYDLDAELGGIEDGIAHAYAKRLWQDFRYTFPRARSYGFSVAVAPGRIANMIRVLDETGQRPSEYAIDIYDKPNVPQLPQQLGFVADDLAQMGDAWKPVMVQETFANDYDSLREIVAATSRLRIRAIAQWPLSRASSDNVTDMDYASNYHAYLTYLKAPTIDRAGAGCDDGHCLWIIAENVEGAATVDVRSRATGALLHTYAGSALNRSVSGAQTTLTLRLATGDEVSALASGGLSAYVVNPNAAKWSNPGNVP